MIDLTITQALEKLKSREISATELTLAYLERIEKYGADLNCYITVTPERALSDAADKAGVSRGYFAVPKVMEE